MELPPRPFLLFFGFLLFVLDLFCTSRYRMQNSDSSPPFLFPLARISWHETHAVAQAFGTGSDDSSCRLFDMRCYGEANYFGNDKVCLADTCCVVVFFFVCGTCTSAESCCRFPLAFLLARVRRVVFRVCLFFALFLGLFLLIRRVVFRENHGSLNRNEHVRRARTCVRPCCCRNYDGVLLVSSCSGRPSHRLSVVALDPVRHHVGGLLAEWSPLVCGLRRLQLLRVGRDQ